MLTETSNILDWGVNEPLRSRLWVQFQALIHSVSEVYIPSVNVASEPEFSRLGLADCAWLGCVDNDTPLVTIDELLFLAASARGLNVYHFEHLRIACG